MIDFEDFIIVIINFLLFEVVESCCLEFVCLLFFRTDVWGSIFCFRPPQKNGSLFQIIMVHPLFSQYYLVPGSR